MKSISNRQNNQFRFIEIGNVTISAPQGIIDWSLTLPVDNGQPSQVLTTDGDGITSWTTLPTTPGTGSVTSVGLILPSSFLVTNSPITTAGSINVAFSGTPIPVLYGGTGVNTKTGTGALVLNNNPTFTGMVSTASLSSNSLLLTNGPNETIWQSGASSTYTLTTPTSAGSSGQFLKTDGLGHLSWQSGNAGTVTSVDMTVPSGFAISGNPITGSGTLDLTLSAIPVLKGGTGATAITGSGNNVLSVSPSFTGTVVATNITATVLRAPTISIGTTALTNILSGASLSYTLVTPPNAGTIGQILTTNGAGVLSWTNGTPGPPGGINSIGLSMPTGFSVTNSPLTADGTLSVSWSGAVPISNGGTGATATTGSGQNVLSASPTFTGTIGCSNITATGTLSALNLTAVADISSATMTSPVINAELVDFIAPESSIIFSPLAIPLPTLKNINMYAPGGGILIEGVGSGINMVGTGLLNGGIQLYTLIDPLIPNVTLNEGGLGIAAGSINILTGGIGITVGSITCTLGDVSCINVHCDDVFIKNGLLGTTSLTTQAIGLLSLSLPRSQGNLRDVLSTDGLGLTSWTTSTGTGDIVRNDQPTLVAPLISAISGTTELLSQATSAIVLNLPPTVGNLDDVLSTDGSGLASWKTSTGTNLNVLSDEPVFNKNIKVFEALQYDTPIDKIFFGESVANGLCGVLSYNASSVDILNSYLKIGSFGSSTILQQYYNGSTAISTFTTDPSLVVYNYGVSLGNYRMLELFSNAMTTTNTSTLKLGKTSSSGSLKYKYVLGNLSEFSVEFYSTELKFQQNAGLPVYLNNLLQTPGIAFTNSTFVNSIISNQDIQTSPYLLQLPLDMGTAGYILETDGINTTSWVPSTGGTVTSVAMSVPNFLQVANSPIITSGSLDITLSGFALPTSSGGTGVTGASTGSGGVVLSISPALTGDWTSSGLLHINRGFTSTDVPALRLGSNTGGYYGAVHYADFGFLSPLSYTRFLSGNSSFAVYNSSSIVFDGNVTAAPFVLTNNERTPIFGENVYVTDLFAPNLVNGSKAVYRLGKSAADGLQIYYFHNSNGDPTNNVSFTFGGLSNLAMYGTGEVKVFTSFETPLLNLMNGSTTMALTTAATSNFSLVLPPTVGSSGDILVNTGSGNTSWSATPTLSNLAITSTSVATPHITVNSNYSGLADFIMTKMLAVNAATSSTMTEILGQSNTTGNHATQEFLYLGNNNVGNTYSIDLSDGSSIELGKSKVLIQSLNNLANTPALLVNSTVVTTGDIQVLGVMAGSTTLDSYIISRIGRDTLTGNFGRTLLYYNGNNDSLNFFQSDFKGHYLRFGQTSISVSTNGGFDTDSISLINPYVSISGDEIETLKVMAPNTVANTYVKKRFGVNNSAGNFASETFYYNGSNAVTNYFKHDYAGRELTFYNDGNLAAYLNTSLRAVPRFEEYYLNTNFSIAPNTANTVSNFSLQGPTCLEGLTFQGGNVWRNLRPYVVNVTCTWCSKGSLNVLADLEVWLISSATGGVKVGGSNSVTGRTMGGSYTFNLSNNDYILIQGANYNGTTTDILLGDPTYGNSFTRIQFLINN